MADDDIEQPDDADVEEVEDAPEEKPLPTHKSELVNLAMQKPHRVPSYEAWAMTVPELTAKLKES